MTDVMLAYNTPIGRADYVGGSGLAGEAQYTIAGRTLAHSAGAALVARRNRKGRRVPARGATMPMSADRARKIAIQCIEAEIKRLSVNANLHDLYHADAPACVEASTRRATLRAAILALKAPHQSELFT